jgi:putative transposase
VSVTDDQLEIAPARQAINEMVDAGLLDHLMSRVDGDGLALTGQGGLLPELVKAVLERGLQAELTGHLGYEKGDPAGRGSPNSRNGTTPKTLASEVGDIPLAVPRDRSGSFEPRLVPKGSRRAGGLDDMIISLYAGGMTVRDIQHHLARTLGTELSHDTISTITDAVLEEVKACSRVARCGRNDAVPWRDPILMPGAELRGRPRPGRRSASHVLRRRPARRTRHRCGVLLGRRRYRASTTGRRAAR